MANNTINKEEIEKFSKLAEEWWDTEGKFKPLHKFNPIRIEYIKKSIVSEFNIKNVIKPFSNLEILDIGCGGGLLTEPMCRLGGNLTGIDASEKNIKIAKIHAKKNDLKINYFCDAPENFKIGKKFDVILNMEIVEHVNDLNLFIESSSKLLKKDGIMFVATINRTFESYIKAIVGAEYLLRWLPIGTHSWEKFLKHNEIEHRLNKLNLRKFNLDGLRFNIMSNSWNLSENCSVNYIMVAKKN